jgi:hypothetical protein
MSWGEITTEFDLNRHLGSTKKKGTARRLKKLFEYLYDVDKLTIRYTYKGETASFNFTIEHTNNEDKEFFDPKKHAHDEYLFLSDDKPGAVIKFTLLVSKLARSGLYLDLIQAAFMKDKLQKLNYKTSQKLKRKGVSTYTVQSVTESNFGVKKKGEWMIHLIMDFASFLELDFVELSDESHVPCGKNNTKISLFWAKTMSEGVGWYEKNGFNLDPSLKEEIMRFRMVPVSRFQKIEFLLEEEGSPEIPRELMQGPLFELWNFLVKYRCELLPLLEEILWIDNADLLNVIFKDHPKYSLDLQKQYYPTWEAYQRNKLSVFS